MAFPIIHGLTLASGSTIENFVVESLATDPAIGSLAVGRIWYNTTDKLWKTATLAADGSVQIQRMTTRDITDAINTRVTTLENDTFFHDGRNAMTGHIDMDGNSIVNVPAPTAASHATNKDYVDQKIANLGNAFEYVGTIDASSASDLDLLVQKEAGDLYKIIVGGTLTWNSGSNSMVVNAGDAIVWNPSGGVDKFDNTNSEVFGQSNEIIVTGSTDAGFTVSIDPVYTQTITDAISSSGDTQSELDATQVAAGINDDGTYSVVSGANYIGSATSTKEATQILDTQSKANADAVAAEVVARTAAGTSMRTAVGLNADGSYKLAAGVTYIGSASSTLDATRILDVQAKANADAIVAETTRATNEETAIDLRLSNVEGQVNGVIGDPTTLTTDAQDNLVNAINEVDGNADANAAAITALDGKARAENQGITASVNARMHTFESTTQAQLHTINHGLNCPNVLATVLVHDPVSNSWQRDLVGEVATDADTYTVELSVARNVRVSLLAISAIQDSEWATA